MLPPLASKSSMPYRRIQELSPEEKYLKKYLNSEEDIRMLSLSQTIEEER